MCVCARLFVCAVVVLFSALLEISVIVPPPPTSPLLFGRFIMITIISFVFFSLFCSRSL